MDSIEEKRRRTEVTVMLCLLALLAVFFIGKAMTAEHVALIFERLAWVDRKSVV